MSASTLFFDLDGTLVDSEAGIVASIARGFTGLGLEVPPPTQLRSWIGPPLRDSFADHLHGDAARVEQALALYREHYDASGWRQHRLFDGIAELIAALQAQGRQLAVVTSKNERFARRIVEHLPFADAFVDVIGASDDGVRRFKVDLIAEALRRLSLSAPQCVMIGDRKMDIEGAAAHAMRSIGVLWGFGDAAELRAAGAGALAATPAELLAQLR